MTCKFCGGKGTRFGNVGNFVGNNEEGLGTDKDNKEDH